MSDVERMQKLLDTVITRIEDLEDQIKSIKGNTDAKGMFELREAKKKLAIQQRVKITLIQSIQDLAPSSNTMTVFTPLKMGNFLNKMKNLFKRSST
jgi:hypothetical protein